MEEVTGGLRQLNKEGIHGLYPSVNIVRVFSDGGCCEGGNEPFEFHKIL
jgi:hypothetical protein